MSIKKLFGSTDKNRNYLSDTNEKDAFSDVESSRNVSELSTKQDGFLPQIDYSEPANFAKYGSAYLYYKSAVERILDYYPYDGSSAEVTKFYNESLDIEKYVFNDRYPRTTGYALLSADGWGTRVGALSGAYGRPSTLEYIDFVGGPNTSSYSGLVNAFSNPHDSKFQHSNIYDTDIYQTEGLPSDYGSGTRQSNLKCDFDTGVTIEFWLQKATFDTVNSAREVVFDLWNNNYSASADHGRVTVELRGTAGSPFLLTAQSGTSGFITTAIGQNITGSTLQSWGHYAIVLQNVNTQLNAKLYVNGELNHTLLSPAAGTLGALNSKNMQGRIGSFITAPSGAAGSGSGVTYQDSPSDWSGMAKLSASLDEFRFWKVARNAQEIGRNWKTNVYGGVNTDISNTTLGLYYKFNEGITTTATIDNIVLDYSGRLGNGIWTGYDTKSRNTGSAIVSASAAAAEYPDPIIYSTHPDVVSLKQALLESGSFHDSNNNNSFLSLMPAWVIEDQDDKTSELRKLSHIAGVYFDKLFLQISALPSFKSTTYTSASYKPYPFAEHLPQSLGLYSPEIFIDSNIMEKFLNKNDSLSFESDLMETKNLIYLNLYNNLASIFKNKGTEKAIKNVFRCFNIDDRLIKLNVYSNNQIYELKNNLEQTLIKKTSMNQSASVGGTVVQYWDSDSDSRAFLSGSSTVGISGGGAVSGSFPEYIYGFTTEVDVTFPLYDDQYNTVDRSYPSCSLLGIHQLNESVGTGSTTISGSDIANFQIFAARESEKSKNVKFILTSLTSPSPFPTLTSSVFLNVYDDTHWNLSVRVKPNNYPLANIVTGAIGHTYDVIFRGVREEMGVIQDNFVLTGSMTKVIGQKAVAANKRMYVGARRTNMTGTILQTSDVLLNGCRYWYKYLEDSDLDKHTYDFNNVGISASYQDLSPRHTGSQYRRGQNDLLNFYALGLNWNFDNVTGSDSGGNFTVTDISSGSTQTRNNFGWLGKVAGYQHPGKGFGYLASSTKIVKKQNVNSFKFVNPEKPISSDMIQILSDDDQFYGVTQTVPSYFYTIEKSIYNAISEEMLTFFAGVIDFNNLIGEPVNRYRDRYKSLEKLREMFFRKVTEVKDVEKYVEYYKWLDDSISLILAQLMPASAEYVADVLNTIESHVLERNKYQSRFPTLEYKSSTEAPMLGINEKTYNWKYNHHPVSDSQKENSDWWRERAERSASTVISSGDVEIDKQRDTIIRTADKVNNQTLTVFRKPDRTSYARIPFVERKLAKPYKLNTKRIKTYKGGVNFPETKNIHFTLNALYPGGPINATDKFVPLNVLYGDADDIVNLLSTNDVKEPWNKTKRIIKVQHARDWEDGVGYRNVKSSYAFPFSILSSSTNAVVKAGYGKEVTDRLQSDLEIVNLHHDAYGPDLEVPMQGPFTNHAVGGLQYRHIAINTGSTLDTYLTRPEGWKLLLGKFVGITGAVGMVGPDYPYPEANDPSSTPYPVTGAQKAYLYRDHVAKRPVNIRNIHMKTGSMTTILGNFSKRYEVVHSVGAFSNPRAFIDNQPALPSQITDTPSASQNRSMFDTRRTDQSHVQFVPDYSLSYLDNTPNKTIIIGRFRAPGGIEVQGRGYQDIRAAEMSVYNALNYRNLSVRRPTQNPTGSINEAVGESTTGIRVFNIHGQDFGLQTMLTRHSNRFGRDSVLVTSPGAAIGESPSFVKVNRNRRKVLIPTSDTAYGTSSQFDNFWVQRQIPRADRQYAWVTGSIVDAAALRYHGLAPVHGPLAGYYSSSATGHTAYFNYVSGSSVQGNSASSSLYQPNDHLSIFIAEPVDDSTTDPNVLGHPAGTSVLLYLNATLMDKFNVTDEINSLNDYFNLLMASRRSGFGWSWTSARLAAHPILVKHRKNNNLSVYNNQQIKDYRLPPVSMRGRPAVMQIEVSGVGAITAKTTHNNESIYFNDTALNDLQYSSLPDTITPFDQLVSIGKQKEDYNLKWVLYSEALFPSLRNEFSSSTYQRTDYDNKYWRTSNAARVTLGKTFANSFGVTVSQSSWLLDPQDDFLTRTVPAGIGTTAEYTQLIGNGDAGELQNNYFHIVQGPQARTAAANAVRSLAASGLYARKHVLSSKNSVVSPSGMLIPETGSLPVEKMFGANIDVFGGEAKWEAGSQAGIIIKEGGVATFESHSSEPWFNEYADYKQKLRLIAKDYAVVPEFRISEHVGDYIKYGLFNDKKLDTFEIPGTTINSSQANFYKDYSNSDFMRNFLQIKEDTLLNAKEIRLVCSGVIRFNPYKGFYPAQRTLDLVTQFSSSYGKSFSSKKGPASIVQQKDGHLRPLMQTLYSPGILYNSIKSGIAVNYPIVTDETKVNKTFFGAATAGLIDDWMITSANTASSFAQEGYASGLYWDYKVPFEALLKPEKYLDGLDFIDLEPHPSATLDVTSSFAAHSTDSIYSNMAENFFGEVANFFLKDSSFTRLESEVITSDLEFAANTTYLARLKIRRSSTGPRTYQHDSGAAGNNSAYSTFGGKSYVSNAFRKGSFPLPQDPKQNPLFRENFTMYSRPTAFGPPVAGRPYAARAAVNAVKLTYPLDGLSGFNGAYTPPYYNGEAWIDFIFRPQANTKYDLEKILTETKTAFWRVDPGVSASAATTTPTNFSGTVLIPTFSDSEEIANVGDLIYEGKNINQNSMQLSASVNYLGVERIVRQRTDQFGNPDTSENETVGKKWIIQPKFETPMLNFSNEGVHPITNAASNLALPTFASQSVPRGMWHQFGVMPEDPSKGVFLEIGDIPTSWLKNHYSVINNNSVYNNENAAGTGSTLFKTAKSLTDIVKFTPEQASTRLGEIADSRTIKEAIVAVPYITQYSDTTGEFATQRKQFISIPQERVDASLDSAVGSATGDSLTSAGQSIRRQIEKMQDYVFPPQFDFLSSESVEPIVMYIFEFEYNLDKDDLSYIWQNLAPRKYKKITTQVSSVAHELVDTELLNESNLMENENLRWMVFKVKQKSKNIYSDLMVPQVGQSTGDQIDPNNKTTSYNVSFNWPYDYLSFVELIKIDAEVLYHNPMRSGSHGGGSY